MCSCMDLDAWQAPKAWGASSDQPAKSVLAPEPTKPAKWSTACMKACASGAKVMFGEVVPDPVEDKALFEPAPPMSKAAKKNQKRKEHKLRTQARSDQAAKSVMTPAPPTKPAEQKWLTAREKACVLAPKSDVPEMQVVQQRRTQTHTHARAHARNQTCTIAHTIACNARMHTRTHERKIA